MRGGPARVRDRCPLLLKTASPFMTLPQLDSTTDRNHIAAAPAPRRAVLSIEGMHCAGCVARVENALTRVPGVTAARVNLVTAQASVELEPAAAVDALVGAVEQGGYHARILGKRHDDGERLRKAQEAEAAGWRRRAAVGLGALGPMAYLTHIAHATATPWLWVQFLLATLVQFYVGWPYFLGAWRRLRHGGANMDSLIALGTGTAYAAGTYGFITALVAHHATAHGPVMYLGDAVMILAFISLGKHLETRAKGRASQAIRRLLDLTPAEAHVVRDGQPVRVPVEAVVVGETIVIRPGEKVPLDARVLSGSSAVDQSWLTGESMPVDKEPGDEVLAGTINGQGALTAEVVRGADETALAQVIELVRHAQESKTEVGRLADRVVAYFVPTVLAIAAAAFVAWGPLAGSWEWALATAVAVLVVACPCALGLATPTAILVGSGRGAERGILIKEAHALETAGRLTMVVIDKTGTVTSGRFRVTELMAAEGVDPDTLLATAAAVERLSGHPLGKAVVAAAETQGLEIPPAEALEVLPGQGVRATIGERPVFVGNGRLLAAAGVALGSLAERVEAARDGGTTPLLVAEGERLLGAITVADTVAPGSREAIARLHAMGLETMLLTGDHRRTAEAVAAEVGIGTVTAEVLPNEKHEVVRRLQQRGQVVAMVGDGINDAPALAAADLGIAIGSGADVAIESAEVILVEQDLGGVADAIGLSRATLRTIWQNLGWAFAYNLLLLPLAAGLFIRPFGIHLPPAAAAAAMAASSVSVVTNSLLLRRRKI